MPLANRRNLRRGGDRRSAGRSRSPAPRSGAGRFDADYYRRYYRDPRTRVTDLPTIRRLAGLVVAWLHHLGLPLRSVLDLGCGIGHWRAALQRAAPRARHCGVELSDYLCAHYGWTRGSVVDYRPRRQFDLVVCQGVLQYLTDADAERAIDNLAALTRGALYLEALTERDWRENCDRSTTDSEVRLRSGDWYRRRLRRHFVALGGGLFLARSAPATTFELETLA